ncbi:cache domain-containing protein [Pseudorhizobium flavum]|uniref:cache domain-containing protein n=1 Tax=Pseudorhizobium flavum TaxID=1335061 RepID=UPI00248FE4D8|nr:cache domain-containing protein [Pseudorhizobium flavum]
MAKPIRKSTAPSLAVITLSFVLASAFIGLFIAYQVISDRARSFEKTSLTRAVETRARGVQVALAQALYREWNSLTAIRQQFSSLPPQEMEELLSSLAGTGETISWAGYASNDGAVVAASNGLLVNADVSSRPWFQRGLDGDFAGDFHEAVLLAKKLPAPEDGGPLRFLDLATPIAGSDGSIAGVVGLHLNAQWAESLVTELAHAMNIDVFIVNPEGKAVVATDGGSYAGLELASFTAARSGAAGTHLEMWPDGRSYFTATIPELGYRNLPKFGWSIIARISADNVLQPARVMSFDLMVRLIAFGLLLMLLTTLFIVWYIRPFELLAANAEEIAEGKDVYPFESNRTRELSLIGSALARLQATTPEEIKDEQDLPSRRKG